MAGVVGVGPAPYRAAMRQNYLAVALASVALLFVVVANASETPLGTISGTAAKSNFDSDSGTFTLGPSASLAVQCGLTGTSRVRYRPVRASTDTLDAGFASDGVVIDFSTNSDPYRVRLRMNENGLAFVGYDGGAFSCQVFAVSP